MVMNIYEYALTLSWTQTPPQQNRAINLISPPRILVNVVNVPIEINESH